MPQKSVIANYVLVHYYWLLELKILRINELQEWRDLGPSCPRGLADAISSALVLFSHNVCLQGHRMAATNSVLNFLPALNPRISFRSQNLTISHCVLESGLCVYFQADDGTRGMHCGADGLGWSGSILVVGVWRRVPSPKPHGWEQERTISQWKSEPRFSEGWMDTDNRCLSTTERYYGNPHITVEKTKIPKG